jgi:Zn-dependent peptidase ImmA (M78 family)
MAKRAPGKLWFKFSLFGLLDGGKTMACCLYNERRIYLADNLTHEQQRITFAHELEHAIEDHCDVDYTVGVSEDVADRLTEQMARAWVYVIRHCPEIVNFLRAE